MANPTILIFILRGGIAWDLFVLTGAGSCQSDLYKQLLVLVFLLKTKKNIFTIS